MTYDQMVEAMATYATSFDVLNKSFMAIFIFADRGGAVIVDEDRILTVALPFKRSSSLVERWMEVRSDWIFTDL